MSYLWGRLNGRERDKSFTQQYTWINFTHWTLLQTWHTRTAGIWKCGEYDSNHLRPNVSSGHPDCPWQSVFPSIAWMNEGDGCSLFCFTLRYANWFFFCFFFLSYSSFIQSPCSCVCFCLSLWMRIHEERISHKQCKLLCLKKSRSCVHLDPAVSLHSCFSLEQLSGQWQNQLSFPWSGVKRVGIWADVHFCVSSCLISGWNVQKAEIRGLEILKLVKLNCGAGPFSEMSSQDLWKMWELRYISVLKWLHIKQSNHHYQSSLPPSKI